MTDTIIPGMPDELALSCLARLPRALLPRARCVSRAWKHAMQPSAMDALRKSLTISEAWPVVLCQYLDAPIISTEQLRWFLIDPLLLRCYPLPPPPLPPSFVCEGTGLQAMAAGSQVLLAGIQCLEPSLIRRRDLEHVYCFDALSMQWQAPAPPMRVDRTAFSSSTLDGYVYVAGGVLSEALSCGSHFESLQSVERLDMKTKLWEDVPDMQQGRMWAAGVVLQGCFCVIGGYRSSRSESVWQHSGEMWDPRTRKWSLVPELWPDDIFQGCYPPQVAVVMGRLYALRPDSEDVMYYDHATKLWISLGCFQTERCNSTFNNMHRLRGVGEELWVVVEGRADCRDSFILATVPTITQPLSWRLLPFPFDPDLVFTKVSVCV